MANVLLNKHQLTSMLDECDAQDSTKYEAIVKGYIKTDLPTGVSERLAAFLVLCRRQSWLPNEVKIHFTAKVLVS